ncbi:glycosyltransferase [uncultured Roseobacter sp.]|uniref:glycosyltransferase n=1 Tax=uncultured Roseobacter sp. TaxID=114847 RepID=UPI00262EDA53|nr:glycosyltransferase [uncultured Roseobacter sp.]
MKHLLVISSAPAQVTPEGVVLDKKFLEGMRSYCAGWSGQVHCILQKTGTVPFGTTVDPEDLPFELQMPDAAARLSPEQLAQYDVILCSGDNHRYFYLADLCQTLPVRLYYIIEYILETRLQIIQLDAKLSPLRKLKGVLWTLRQERRRRRAFRRADGLQANGYPADAAYRGINANTVRYLDNRVRRTDMATGDEMAARRAHLEMGNPLRLIHSGRLERMKGSHDLIPIARRLRDRGVDFRLDIFGTGSLEEEIRTGIGAAGLQDHVHLHGTVDFQSELVPFTRTKSDIFLSCHRQSDPSCTYLEALGCGVAVAGYANRMWQALQQQSGAGWVAPLGKPEALADVIAAAAADRADVSARCDAALTFAQSHSFETEFNRRIAHLAGTSLKGDASAA